MKYIPLKATLYCPMHDDFAVTCAFAKRSSTWSSGWHTGIDLASRPTSVNNPIYSVYDGVVEYISTDVAKAYGNTIVIRHSNVQKQFGGTVTLFTRYAHLSKIFVKVGQKVNQSTVIGREGHTGGSNSFVKHLHFELSVGNYKYPSGKQPVESDYLDPILYLKKASNGRPLYWYYKKGVSTDSMDKNYDDDIAELSFDDKYKDLVTPAEFYQRSADNVYYLYQNGITGGATVSSGQSGILSTVSGDNTAAQIDEVSVDYEGIIGVVNAVNAAAGTLLQPTEEEKKYGATTYVSSQPYISLDTQAGTNGTSSKVISTLTKYSRYLYDYLNSNMCSAQVQTVAMPWIRPGFNVWLDPANLDKVYYVKSVSHTGSAGNVYTSLGLSAGRSRTDFVNGNCFGSWRRISGSKTFDNVFISEISVEPSAYGAVIGTKDMFSTIKTDCVNFYSATQNNTVEMLNNPYFMRLYNEENTKISSGTTSSSQNTLAEGSYVSVSGQAYVNYSATTKGSYYENRIGKVLQIKTGAAAPYNVSGIGWCKKETLTVYELSKSSDELLKASKGTSVSYSNREEIQNMLNEKYQGSGCPAIIQKRAKNLYETVKQAEKYIDQKYKVGAM